MAAKDIVTESKIKIFLDVNDAKLTAMRAAGLPYIDMGDDYRLYNQESVATWLSDYEYFAGEERRYYPVDWNDVYNGHSNQVVTSNSAADFGFQVPADFGSLISIKAICIPESGAAGAGKSITLVSNYAKEGQNCTTQNETDTNSYTLAAGGDDIGALDLSAVFTALEAGDRCGVNIQQNSIGGSVHYLAVELVYSRGAP